MGPAFVAVRIASGVDLCVGVGRDMVFLGR